MFSIIKVDTNWTDGNNSADTQSQLVLGYRLDRLFVWLLDSSAHCILDLLLSVFTQQSSGI